MELWPTIWAYSDERFAAMARKAIYSLQRTPATGIFGDDSLTLWDEYCYEIQQGPHDLLDYAWDEVIHIHTWPIIEKIPPTERPLLELAIAYWVLEADDEDDLMAGKSIVLPVGDEELRKSIVEKLNQIAGNRNLERFEQL